MTSQYGTLQLPNITEVERKRTKWQSSKLGEQTLRVRASRALPQLLAGFREWLRCTFVSKPCLLNHHVLGDVLPCAKTIH